jgi:hypothetical protein
LLKCLVPSVSRLLLVFSFSHFTVCTVQNPKLVQKFGTFAPIQFQIWNVPISSFMGARPSISESLGGVIFHMVHNTM